jgi:hypothetical protein
MSLCFNFNNQYAIKLSDLVRLKTSNIYVDVRASDENWNIKLSDWNKLSTVFCGWGLI